jgi:hypothetical protein
MGTTDTSTLAGAKHAKVKADEKVQTLLAEVLRRCDSILEALGGTGGGGGGVVLPVVVASTPSARTMTPRGTT